jgi:hypothetical protein
MLESLIVASAIAAGAVAPSADALPANTIPCYLTGTCTSGPLETTLGGTGRVVDNVLGGVLHGSGEDPLSQILINLLGRRL